MLLPPSAAEAAVKPGTRGRNLTRRATAIGNLGNFFRTPPEMTQALLARELFPPRIAEPACGDGTLARELTRAGYDVVASDLYDRGFGETGVDFLRGPLPRAEALITNPPFDLWTDFARRAVASGEYRKVALLAPVPYLEGQRRAEAVFARHQLSRLWVFTRRQTLWRGDADKPQSKGGMIAYAWFVWERGHFGGNVGFID